MENKERDVVVKIREMSTGEEPEAFICASHFDDFNCITAKGPLGVHAALSSDLIEAVGKRVKEQDDRMASASYVALVFHSLFKTVGKDAVMDGVALAKMALDPSPKMIQALAKTMGGMMDEILKEGGK